MGSEAGTILPAELSRCPREEHSPGSRVSRSNVHLRVWVTLPTLQRTLAFTFGREAVREPGVGTPYLENSHPEEPARREGGDA